MELTLPNGGAHPPAAAHAVPPAWRLACGSLVHARLGVPPADLAALPDARLRPDHFAVEPPEAGAGWAGMTKRAVKRAMEDAAWTKLRAERDRRKAARRAQADGAAAGAPPPPPAKRARRDARDRDDVWVAAPGRVRVALDCSWEPLMTSKERGSLVQQINQGFGAIRRVGQAAAAAADGAVADRAADRAAPAAPPPVFLYLTSMTPDADARVRLERMEGFAAWRGVRAVAEHVFTAFRGGAEDALRDVRGDGGGGERSGSSGTGCGAVGDGGVVAGDGPVAAPPPGSGAAAGADAPAASAVLGAGAGAGAGADAVTDGAGGAAAETGGAGAGAGAVAAAGAVGGGHDAAAGGGAGGLSRLVYLTADSPHELPAGPLDVGRVYVVGGLVDRNRHKGATLAAATAAGVAHARLPLDGAGVLADDACRMLTTVHVLHVLAAVVTNGGDWRAALLEAVPPRKQRGFVGGAHAADGEDEDGEAAAEEAGAEL